MRGKAEITESDIILIEQYTDNGKSDVFISDSLKIKRHVVGNITTAFWKRKMENHES